MLTDRRRQTVIDLGALMSTIIIRGEGSVQRRADAAVVHARLRAVGPDAADALEQLADRQQLLLALLDEFECVISQVYTHQVYHHEDNTIERAAEHAAIAQLNVDVGQDIDRVGTVVQLINRAGGDISRVGWQLDDVSGPLRDARTLALADARDRACDYLDAVDGDLGDIDAIIDPATGGISHPSVEGAGPWGRAGGGGGAQLELQPPVLTVSDHIDVRWTFTA